MSTFCFNVSVDPHTYEASDVGANGTTFNIQGRYSVSEDSTIEYSFKRSWSARFRDQFFVGNLSPGGDELSGKWGYAEDDLKYSFIYRRTSPKILIWRPSPAQFKENRIRALWKYALSVALDEVRGKLGSWSYIKEKLSRRTEYVRIVQRQDSGVATESDSNRQIELHCQMTYEELRCCFILKDIYPQPLPVHL